MHTNCIRFLNTISQHIMFATGSMIKNRKIENIADGIMQVHKLYLHHGFNITHMLANCEFKPIHKEKNDLGIELNGASRKEYVPKIERFIWTIKEHVRSARATMLFKRTSKLMIVHIVSSAIYWLNEFTPSTPGAGMSEKISRTIFSWKYGQLQEGLPPTSRRICPDASRG